METDLLVFHARSQKSDGTQQTVKEHLLHVSKLCADNLAPLGCGNTGEILGIFHDFGKYSFRFSEVLAHKRMHVDHAFPGAALLWNTCGGRKSGPYASVLASAAASHHGTIRPFDPDSAEKCLLGKGDGYDSAGNEYSLFGQKDFSEAAAVFRKEIPLSLQKPSLPIPREKYGTMLDRMLCVRMLLSALADADYTDAASDADPSYAEKTADIPFRAEDAMRRLLALREEKRKSSHADTELNRLRDRLFEDCLNAGKGEPGMYTLTAPTGLGKTLSLMAFALSHCVEHPKMRRIILLLPFLAIAKQNADDYKRIFPELLESHSAVHWTEETRQLSERWSSPCIITTNVGFFEPLFADNAVDVRRLHQITNSVIVLDEAQSLPPSVLDATLKTVRALCADYGCTFVFSTATQPSFVFRPGLDGAWSPREIVPNPQTLFDRTRRVRFAWRTDTAVSFDDLADELSGYPSACVIVNLRKHASVLYDAVCRLRNRDEVFLLSKNLCQAHCEAVIAAVRGRLADGLPTLLISTQCIEAGVDLDFPVMFRALAPLESVIQAAGRVNRNGKLPGGGRVTVFIPDVPEDKRYPKGGYYQYAADQVLTLLKRHPIDCFDLSHIREYYELLYTYGSRDKKELTACIEAEDYEGTAREYRMIESGGVQVIVPWAEKEELYREIRARYDRNGLTAALIADARPITVTSFDKKQIKNLCQPLFSRFHGTEEGGEPQWYLLGLPEQYDEKKGLSLPDRPEGFII